MQELADPVFQREVWIKCSRPNIVGSFVELICGIYDDNDLPNAIKQAGASWPRDVYEALVEVIEALDNFKSVLEESGMCREADWIDSAAWRECVEIGQRAIRAIESRDWVVMSDSTDYFRTGMHGKQS